MSQKYREEKGKQDVGPHLVFGTGNKDYTLARLRRDHPDLLEAFRLGLIGPLER